MISRAKPIQFDETVNNLLIDNYQPQHAANMLQIQRAPYLKEKWKS